MRCDSTVYHCVSSIDTISLPCQNVYSDKDKHSVVVKQGNVPPPALIRSGVIKKSYAPKWIDRQDKDWIGSLLRSVYLYKEGR